MANELIALFGKMGKGKTFYSVLWLYFWHKKGISVASNLKVNFKHIPLITLEDIALFGIKDSPTDGKKYYQKTGHNRKMLLDELWKLSDNRKCQTLLNELTDTILLASRKRHLDIIFTQQALQIDLRIAYNVSKWCTPTIYPEKPNKQNPPYELLVERVDGDFQPLTPQHFFLAPYLNLYDSDENAYLIDKMIDVDSIKCLIEKIKRSELK